MAFETTTVPCKSLPAAAAGINITTSATPWANTAYVQVTAGLTPAIQLGSVCIPNTGGSASGDEIEIDIATGTAGNEVVVATIRFTKTATQYAPNTLLRPILDNIAGSIRIAVRARHRDASATTIAIGFNYYEKPTGITQVTAKPHKWWPGGANGIDLNTGASLDSQGQATGTFVELISSVANASVLAGFYAQKVSTTVNTPEWVEFAIGSAGNEVVVATFKIRPRTNAGAHNTFMLPAPLDLFPAGTRVSMRIRLRSITSTTTRCAAMYLENTL